MRIALKHLFNGPTLQTTLVLPTISAALAIGIFVLDTFTDFEIAVEGLYVTVVLISVTFCRIRGVVLVSLGCMALTIISFFLTSNGSFETGLINDAIGIVAIAATTFLALRIKSIELVAYEAKAQLAHIARLTTLGELTTSIAHELNQPLAATSINSNASLLWLAAQPPNLDEVRQAIERIVGDTNRASNIISRIRSLAKKTSPQPELLNINTVIQEILALTGREIQDNHIALNIELTDGLPLILGDRIQLQQVIINLVVNAIEALHETGRNERSLRVISALDASSNAVLVAIHDTGCGLALAGIDQIFDAFYSTKNAGLGMGLTISRSIIEAHRGRIWAEPNRPHGTIFRFVLPATTDELSASSTCPPKQHLPMRQRPMRSL